MDKEGHIIYVSMMVETLSDIDQGVLLVGYFTPLHI
jgi:hypothetical protein